MDILKSLHTSVAQTCEKAFDDAYRDLHAEIKRRDCKLEEAEKKAKCAEEARDELVTEAQELRYEVAVLREELVRSDVDAEGIELSTDRISKLKDTFSPQHTLNFAGNDAVCDLGLDSKKQELVRESYIALYNELMTLIKATDSLKVQIKRHKRKLTHWRECLDRDKFTLVLDGIPIKFERTQRTLGNGRAQKSTASDQAKLISCLGEDSTTSSSELRSKSSSLQSGGLRDLSSLNSERELPNQNPWLVGAAEVSKPNSTHPAPEDEATRQIASSKAKSLLGTCTSDERRLAQTSPSSAVPQFEDSVVPLSLTTADDYPGDSTAIPGSPRYRIGADMRHDKVPGRSLKHAISSIAEDSDERGCKRRMRDLPRDTRSGNKGSHLQFDDNAALTGRRLHELLESPLPPRHSLRPHTSMEVDVHGDNHGQHNRDLTEPARIDLPSNPQSTQTQTEEIQESSARLKLPSELSPLANDCEITGSGPMIQPYRPRPLHRLDLSHFKINPEYNEGLDFAYDDVVRKKHDRESIQGCTRLDCCGQKFLAMARLGGVPSHLEKPENEDRQIVEEYLGEEKSIIDQMTAAEYQDILHEAKARAMANRYGRHRHHHQRPSTPPGFWRADMPDTQEMQYDHEEASKMEKEKVKERYRQAMLPGGLWKFADE